MASAQSTEYELEGGADWAVVQSPEPGSDAAIMAEARRALAADEPLTARRLLDPWIEQHEAGTNPFLPEAYLLRADALVALQREYQALYDYELICREYFESDVFRTAVERELQIGTEYLNGLKRRIWGLRIFDATDVGEELLIRVQERMPGDDMAETAAIRLADFYYGKREIGLARDAYDLYLLNHPRGQHRMHAAKRRIYCDIARFKGPRYDASSLIDAEIEIRAFARRYPAKAEKDGLNEGQIDRLRESRAAALLESVDWYLRRGDWPAARLALRRLVRQYPTTLAAERATTILERRGWAAAEEDAALQRASEPEQTEPGVVDVVPGQEVEVSPPEPPPPPAPEPAPEATPEPPPEPAPESGDTDDQAEEGR